MFIKTSLNQLVSALTWVMNLFDPPPLRSMTIAQKIGRVLLVTTTLVIASVLVAMLGALGLFLIERGVELGSTPQFLNGLGIIVVAVGVNIGCIFILLQIHKLDTKLVPRPPYPDDDKPVS